MVVLVIGCRESGETGGGAQKSPNALDGHVTISLTAPRTLSVIAPVLLGSNSVQLGAGAEVIPSGITVAMGSGGLRAEPDALLNETWSRGPAELRDRVRVRGVLHAANRILGNGVVINSIDANPPFDPPSTLTWTVAYPTPATVSDVILPPDQTRTITPGRYGTVTVNSRATLTLGAGTYYLTNLTIEPQARVRLDQASGPVIIYVSGSLFLRGTFVSATTAPPDLFLGYLGQNTIFLEGVPFNGAIFTPFSTLVLRAVTGEHVGFFAGKDLQVVDAHAKVRYRVPLAIIPAATPSSDACRNLIPLRPDLTGEAQRLQQLQDIARYCPGCQSTDDTDSDGVPDCVDECPYDRLKTKRGICNCGSTEEDTDGDGAPNCIDRCNDDADNVTPGQCGCKGQSNLKPANTPCRDPACPQSNAVCNGAGVCGDRSLCNPCPPNGKFIAWEGGGYWFCGVGKPPGGLPIDGGVTPPQDGGVEPPDPTGGGPTDAGTTPPTGTLPRDTAANNCSSRGLNLVRIDSPLENFFIQRFLTFPLWLGANSISAPNVWRWAAPGTNNGDQFWAGGANGTRVQGRFANWLTGTPGAERCAAMRPNDGRWFDVGCSQSFGYVCEFTVPTVTVDGGGPPGSPGQPPRLTTPCVPESQSGLPSTPEELQQQRAQVEAGIFTGAAANPPGPNDRCPPDDPNAEAIGLDERSGCTFAPTPANCLSTSDCAAFGPDFICRQFKNDPTCNPPGIGQGPDHPVAGQTCEGHAVCGRLICPPIDPARCGQVEICNPGTEFDAGPDPVSNLDAEPFNPAGLFDGGIPDAAPTGAYIDPPTGTGKNHSWCRLNPQDPGSVKPANQPKDTKSGSSGSGTSISFAFDPDLIFDVNANPISFGESEMNVHAQAKFVATASLNSFLGRSYSAPIIDVVAGVTAQRCSISTDETSFQVLGLDFVDPSDLPRINTDDPTISEAAHTASTNCKKALANFKLWGDRAKKSFRDAQQVLAQYHAAKDAGAAFGTDLCQQIGIVGKTVPFFPGGNTCAANEPPEVTINRLIQFYQEPGAGQITQLREAAGALSGATSALRDLIGTEIGVDFVDKTQEESQTIVNVPFAIGPIPMVLQIDVFAKYGITGRFDLELNFPTNMDAPVGDAQRLAHARVGVGPHAAAGLSAFVGAGISLGPLDATLGLEGAITLADVRAPIFAGAGIGMTIETDPRPLPDDIKPPVSSALNAFQFGAPKSFKFFVSYDYGAGLDLRNVLSGEINARLRIKFFFFSRTWRKRVVRFNGWSFHYDLVSGGNHPDVSTSPQTVSGNGGDQRATTQVAQGQTQMGRSESQVPLTQLALLSATPPVFNGDDLADSGPDAARPRAVLSKSTVEQFFYDDLCCNKLGETCVKAGTPQCCPQFECVVPDGGTEGTCQDTACREFGQPCGTQGCCPGLVCGETGQCRPPIG